jgi:hypothetical protein
MRAREVARSAADVLMAWPRFVTAPLYRCWHLRWGATYAEVASAMSGDELVPHPSFTATRAITVAAPPEDVWPWSSSSAPAGPAGTATTCSTTPPGPAPTASCPSSRPSGLATGCHVRHGQRDNRVQGHGV